MNEEIHMFGNPNYSKKCSLGSGDKVLQVDPVFEMLKSAREKLRDMHRYGHPSAADYSVIDGFIKQMVDRTMNKETYHGLRKGKISLGATRRLTLEGKVSGLPPERILATNNELTYTNRFKL